MSTRIRVAVIGGGIVGCSVLYWLTRLGWSDAFLFEKRNLTSGSTWHAAGNVTFFGHYSSITGLYVNSVRTYLDAEQESGQSVGFHAAGSLRLATSQKELDAYRNLEPLYDHMAVEYRLVSNDEIGEIHPLLVTEGLFGAAYTPGDGHVDPTGATLALARAARMAGAVVKQHCPVTFLEPAGTGWKIIAGDTEFLADHVVLANSFWAREMATPLGLNLPIYPLQHHEVITGPVSELTELPFEVPTVRDPYAPSNTRQEGKGFLCGVYESSPEFWAVDGIPPNFAEELLAPDLERLEPHLLRVMERIPAFGKAGIKTINNGPICYTPDGCPLLGPVDGLPGLWLATGFCIGIGTGGGSAEYLARWMDEGAPAYDLPIVYPSRFPNDLSRDDCLTMIGETYAKGYVLPDPLPVGS